MLDTAPGVRYGAPVAVVTRKKLALMQSPLWPMQGQARAVPPSMSFGRFFLRAYSFVLVVAICGVTPGCNFMFSGHSGLFWLLLPFGLPYALVRSFLWWRAAHGERRRLYARHAVLALLLYGLIALPISAAATYSIERTFGLPGQGCCSGCTAVAAQSSSHLACASPLSAGSDD